MNGGQLAYFFGRPIEGSTAAEATRAQEQIEFMSTTSVPDQVRLCRERMVECMTRMVEVARQNEWKILIRNNKILFADPIRISNESKELWGGVGCLIGPDTYKLCYMETALLSTGLSFVDELGYSNQDTLRWASIEAKN